MSVTKYNPNSFVDGLEFNRGEYANGDPTATVDRLRVHRSENTGRLVMNCCESTDDRHGNIADLVFDAEDALVLADWILEKFQPQRLEAMRALFFAATDLDPTNPARTDCNERKCGTCATCRGRSARTSAAPFIPRPTEPEGK